jgi:hypothetical protein
VKNKLPGAAGSIYGSKERIFYAGVEEYDVEILSEPDLILRFFKPHGATKFGEPKYSEVRIRLTDKSFPKFLQAMLKSKRKTALRAMSDELQSYLGPIIDSLSD